MSTITELTAAVQAAEMDQVEARSRLRTLQHKVRTARDDAAREIKEKVEEHLRAAEQVAKTELEIGQREVDAANARIEATKQALAKAQATITDEQRAKANEELNKKLAAAYALIAECTQIADENDIMFYWELQKGMDGHYDPSPSKPYNSPGWQPSSMDPC